MKADVEITISLPEELLRPIDAECRARRISRNEFVKDAVVEFFERREEAAAVRDYAESYLQEPEDEGPAEAFVKLNSTAFSAEEHGGD